MKVNHRVRFIQQSKKNTLAISIVNFRTRLIIEHVWNKGTWDSLVKATAVLDNAKTAVIFKKFFVSIQQDVEPLGPKNWVKFIFIIISSSDTKSDLVTHQTRFMQSNIKLFSL